MSTIPALILNAIQTGELNVVEVTDPNNLCLKTCCSSFQVFDNSSESAKSADTPYIAIHLTHLDATVVFKGKDSTEVSSTVSTLACIISCITESLLQHLALVNCVGKNQVNGTLLTNKGEARFSIDVKETQGAEVREEIITAAFADMRYTNNIGNKKLLLGLNSNTPAATIQKIRAKFKKILPEEPFNGI